MQACRLTYINTTLFAGLQTVVVVVVTVEHPNYDGCTLFFTYISTTIFAGLQGPRSPLVVHPTVLYFHSDLAAARSDALMQAGRGGLHIGFTSQGVVFPLGSRRCTILCPHAGLQGQFTHWFHFRLCCVSIQISPLHDLPFHAGLQVRIAQGFPLPTV